MKIPVKFQLGVECSVVSPDDFGQEAVIKLDVIPVIVLLVEQPISAAGEWPPPDAPDCQASPEIRRPARRLAAGAGVM